MMKDSDVKKIIKAFNKYGKGLRPDGVYVLGENNMIFSSIINNIHGTPGVFSIKFLDDTVNKAFSMLDMHTLIDGVGFNRILSGTGLKITLDDCDKVEKVENNESEWQNENHSSIEKAIINKYNKVHRFMDNIEYTVNIPESIIAEFIEMKTFIVNLCDYIDLPGLDILKVTNKTLKNFSKTTISISLDVSIKYDDLRVVDFTTIDSVSETHSIYGILVE